MPSKIAIIDYQMGNLRSVQKALERVGGDVFITEDPNNLDGADKLVLPGVGAFGDAIRALRQLGWNGVIHDWIRSNRPFLGICLGLQLLFDASEESPEEQGLGIFPGKVVRFQLPREFKVPHIGWNEVVSHKTTKFNEVGPSDNYYYFVHSYYVVPDDPELVWLSSDYGTAFCAAIQLDHLIATQFHPEKSQATGLALLRRFVAI